MKVKPDLSFWKLWNISFGFLSVQIAYALQSANISRIFSTLGADPHNLSYFWILPPLAGIIVQPIVGAASDKTWTRFGRRIPYLFIGSLVAVLVMCLLPNAGSFGMAVSTAMIFGLVQFFCWFAFMFMWTYTNGSIAANAFDAPTVEHLVDGVTKVVLDTKSLQYQNAADWVGVLFAVQAIGSVLWAICIPMFKDRRFIYALSLVLGGIGFISTYFVHSPYVLFVSFLLIGCAWAAMLALPFTILTNALSGGHMGTYLGLFNGTICIPQIVAAALGGSILALFTPEGMLPPEINMLVTAGVMLIIGAACVYLIKETKGERA